MRTAHIIGITLALAGCAAPQLTNLTPSTVARSAVPLYPLRAQVEPRGNRIAHVQAVIDGVPWSMMALPDGQHAVGYFADPCAANIAYHFNVGYQRRNLLGSGYASTVHEKRFPEASGHVMTVTGGALPDACAAPIGLTLRVDSQADAVDAAPGDGVCRTAARRCSLRAAVMESNAHQGHDLIEIPSGTYTLTLTGDEAVDAPNDRVGDLDLTDGVTLTGLARATRNDNLQTIIDGGAIDRIFDIYAPSPHAVTLTYLSLENGRPMGSGGGAIWNRGNLRMDRMLLRNSRIEHDVAVSCGSSPGLRVCNRGGALFNEGQALIARTTLEANLTTTGHTSGHGGALSNHGPSARLYLRDSLVTGNKARFWGGLLNYQGTVDILNSTFADNESTSSGATAAEIGNVGGTVTARNATFSNRSQLFSHTGAGELRLANSLVEIKAYRDLPFCNGTLVSGGFNVIGGSNAGLDDFFSGCGYTAGAADRTDVRLYLRPLGDYGGPTRTLALREPSPESPYFDPIDLGGLLCPGTDQRGYLRDDRQCDPGAFEY